MAFRLLGIYRDNMVAAADKPFMVRAFGEGQEAKFVLRAAGEETTLVAKNRDGVFEVEFPPHPASFRPYRLEAESEGVVRTAEHILFGDVILAIGQSNMSWELSRTEWDKKHIARAKAAGVRAFNITEIEYTKLDDILRPYEPQRELRTEFKWLSGDALGDVSAIGVMAATVIAEKKKVPVGVINASMGGLRIEAYLPRAVVEANEYEAEFFRRYDRLIPPERYNKMGFLNFTQISGEYNEKIAPIAGYGITGVIWYLGESSAWDYEFGCHLHSQYKILVNEYRKLFGPVPFATVQIAPMYYEYGDGYGYLYVNEALDDASRELPDCYVVPTYDVEPRWKKDTGGNWYHTPIHPINKYKIAERAALSLICGKECGMRISSVKFKGGKALVSISGGGGVKAGAPVYGFALAEKGGKYYGAAARAVTDRQIEVSCSDVKDPAELTFAFMHEQGDCNATDKSGDPLLPYRTEREAVTDRYFFTPPWLTLRRREFYENNFGITAGTCQKLPTWTKGTIYRRGDEWVAFETEADSPTLRVSVTPGLGSYFTFGVSPTLCAPMTPHYLDKFDWLELELESDGPAEFWGFAVRIPNGRVRRFWPTDGKEPVFSVPLKPGEKRRYAVCLTKWYQETFSPALCPVSAEERKNVVEGELVFRAFDRTTVRISSLRLCDSPEADAAEQVKAEETAGDASSVFAKN